ncbi:MAG: transcription termination/antitermination NusG family protein [Hyphomonadaceae bacterium]
MTAAADRRPRLSGGERWFLVNAQNGRETLAAQHLSRQGFRSFLPTTWRTIRHARQIRNERTAFFPGYLFVAMDLERDRWRAIDGTVGVVRLVKADGRPSLAPSGLVETLIEATGEDGVLDLVGGVLREGESVRIIRGPFADQLATVQHMTANDRVRVLLSIMNQSVPVDVMRADLAAL